MQEQVSDANMLVLLAELAKKDNEAFKLILQYENCKDWGDKDMITNKIHHFVKNHPLCSN